VVGAPWIEAERFAKALNDQKFPGVAFLPFYFRPFYGKFAKRDCGGVLIRITDRETFKPVATQYLIIGLLKGLYPKEFKEAMAASKSKHEFFCKVNGTGEVCRIMQELPHVVWPLRILHQEEREAFKSVRQRYLMAEY
jgi:uncharacterized protein YbbC (DUF1343 family)